MKEYKEVCGRCRRDWEEGVTECEHCGCMTGEMVRV